MANNFYRFAESALEKAEKAGERKREHAIRLGDLKRQGEMALRERQELGFTRRTGMEQAGSTRRTGMEQAGFTKRRKLADIAESQYSLQELKGRQAMEQERFGAQRQRLSAARAQSQAELGAELGRGAGGKMLSFTYEQEGTKYPGFYDPSTGKTVYPKYPGETAAGMAGTPGVGAPATGAEKAKQADSLTNFLAMPPTEQGPYLNRLQRENPGRFKALAGEYKMYTSPAPAATEEVLPEGYLSQSISKSGGVYRNY